MPDTDTTPGRRLPLIDGHPDYEMQAGDYSGPADISAGLQAVFFRKPHADDAHDPELPDPPPMAVIVQHVTSATHVFIEEDDGTLTIMGVIPDVFTDPATGFTGPSDGWRGWLEQGRWRQAPPE